MPYGSKYSKMRRPHYRRSKTKRKPTVKKLARRVAKIENAIERKHFSRYSTVDMVAGTTSIRVLTGIAQGDDFSERVGEEIVLKYVDYKVDLYKQQSTSAAPVRIRVICLVDHQANGAQMQVNTGLSPTNVDLATAFLDDQQGSPVWMAPYNYRTVERYKVLFDKLYTINPDSTAEDKLQYHQGRISLHNMKIKFGSSSANIDGQSSKSVKFLAMSSNASTGMLFYSLLTDIYYEDP